MAGLKEITGQSRRKYISFVDQDGYWYPDKPEQQISLIPPSCRECMVCSTVDIVDEKNNRLEKETRKRQALYDRNFSEYTVSEALLKENIIYSSPPLFTGTYSGKLEDPTRMSSRVMTWTYI